MPPSVGYAERSSGRGKPSMGGSRSENMGGESDVDFGGRHEEDKIGGRGSKKGGHGGCITRDEESSCADTVRSKGGQGHATVIGTSGCGRQEKDKNGPSNAKKGGYGGCSTPDEENNGSRSRDRSKDGQGHAAVVGTGSRQAHNRTGLFHGMKLLLGSDTTLEDEITRSGGLILSAVEYNISTHICVEKEHCIKDGKKIVTKEWLRRCCFREALSDQDNVSDVAATMKRSDYDIFMRNHQLFLCCEDSSSYVSLLQYAQNNQGKLQKAFAIPGGDQISIRTAFEAKVIVLRVYTLIKSLKKAGFSLCGLFSLANFVMDEAKSDKNVIFANLPQGSLKKSNPDNDKLDLQRFKEMFRQEFFTSEIIPHDLNVWLSLLEEPEIEGLLPQHAALMDDQQCGEKLMSWYETFKNLELKNRKLYEDIVTELSSYSNWKNILRGPEGNVFLYDTLKYAETSGIHLADDVGGLLQTIRNCRHHEAKDYHASYVLIVAQNFPNLISDLQKVMWKLGLL